MKRRGLQLRPRFRRLLYVISLLLLLTGVCWGWINHLDEIGKANQGLRQMKTKLIAVHGFSAMTFMLLLGALLPGHVRRAWHTRKNRGNGAFFLFAVGLLTVSGYALYYLGNETLRTAVSWFHLWFGVAAPVLLVWHIRSGHRATSRD